MLIDTGSSISLLPSSYKNLNLQPSPVKITNANGKPIDCLGEITLQINIRSLRRNFLWTFVVADVIKPILGYDFLNHFGIIVDCGKEQIIDSATNLQAKATYNPMENLQLSINNISSLPILVQPYIRKYSSVIQPANPLLKNESSSAVSHRIETGDSLPVYAKSRPLPPDKLKAAKDEFNNLLEVGIVRPSSSPWSSPLVLVPKKQPGQWRPCRDYRNLNSISKSDRYSIPQIKTMNSKLHGMSVFSKIDLVRAYNQIPMKEEDIEKTAVTTPFGSFEYVCMPYGLKNAGATFQRFMDGLFKKSDFVFNYIDDLLIFSKNTDEHMKHLEEVFKILHENNLKISVDKCEFFRNNLNFLGFNISNNGLKPTFEKSEAINKFPPPSTMKDLRRFLGMMNFYRNHIPNFAKIAVPLTELTKGNHKNKKIELTDIAKDAFSNLKNALQNATTLNFLHPESNEFQLVTDASSEAVGAALHQMSNGISYPVGFYSKKLSTSQKKYSTFDRELLAAYLAVLHFKNIIEGNTVLLSTDHKPLISAFYSQTPAKSDLQQRYLSLLTEYVSSISYLRGADNIVADCLSRNVNAISIDATDLHAIAQAQMSDQEMKTYEEKLQLFELDNNTKIYCDTSTNHPRPFVPDKLRRSVFENLHGLSHPGVKGTTRLTKLRYFWPSMDRDIKEWSRACLNCQQAKISRHTKSSPLPLEISSERFETIHIDIVGPLPASTSPGSEYQYSYRYILTCIDRNTNWIEAIPLIDITAKSIAYAFLSGWISRFGVPLYVITDRGTQFESELFQEISKLVGFHRLRTTSYHPQTNGKIERQHRTIKSAIMARKQDWMTSLPIVLLGLRCMPNEENISPFQMVTGRSPLLPSTLILKNSTPNVTNQLDFIKQFFNIMRSIDFKSNIKFHSSNKQDYIPNDLKTSTHVWVRVDRVRKSLEAPYQGPFEIISRYNKTYKILLPTGKTDVVSIERLKPAIFKVKVIKNTTNTENTLENTLDLPPAKCTRSRKQVKFAPQLVGEVV